MVQGTRGVVGIQALWHSCGHVVLGRVCVELECKVVAFPSASEETMINNIFSKVGMQPAPGGSPWKTLTMLPKYAQLISMGKRKAIKLPWKLDQCCAEFLKQLFIPCPSLRVCANNALTLPYLLATGSGQPQPADSGQPMAMPAMDGEHSP